MGIIGQFALESPLPRPIYYSVLCNAVQSTITERTQFRHLLDFHVLFARPVCGFTWTEMTCDSRFVIGFNEALSFGHCVLSSLFVDSFVAWILMYPDHPCTASFK